MKTVVSISEARKDLPKIIKEIEKNPGTVFTITVHKDTVAEIRSARPMVQPGEAVRKLLQFRRKLPSAIKDQPKEPISQEVNKFLYLQER